MTGPRTDREAEAAADRARAFHRLYLRLRIDDQLRYYQARRGEYANAHRQAVVLRTALLLGAAAAGVVTQSTAGTARAAWAVAGALLAALAAAVTAFETLVGFPQLEKVYGDAARNLEEAKVDWEDVDPDTVPEREVERVEDVFRSERGQWGQLVVKSAAPARPARPPRPTEHAAIERRPRGEGEEGVPNPARRWRHAPARPRSRASSVVTASSLPGPAQPRQGVEQAAPATAAAWPRPRGRESRRPSPHRRRGRPAPRPAPGRRQPGRGARPAPGTPRSRRTSSMLRTSQGPNPGSPSSSCTGAGCPIAARRRVRRPHVA